MYKQIVVLVHDVTYHAVYALLLLEELLEKEADDRLVVDDEDPAA